MSLQACVSIYIRLFPVCVVSLVVFFCRSVETFLMKTDFSTDTSSLDKLSVASLQALPISSCYATIISVSCLYDSKLVSCCVNFNAPHLP